MSTKNSNENTTTGKSQNLSLHPTAPAAKRVADSQTEQIHVIMYPDINGIERLFGGQLLKWIDEVAAATARRHCGQDVTTVAIDNLNFKAGAYLNDVIVLIGKVTHVGNTSMEVRVDTYREEADGSRRPINRAYFVMVNIGTDGKPTPAPGLILENESEQMEWNNALRRRELRLMRQKEGF